MRKWLIVGHQESKAEGEHNATLIAGEKALLKYARDHRGLDTEEVDEVLANLTTGGYDVRELTY